MGIMNQIKTVVLLGCLSALLIGVGSLFGEMGLFIGLIFALVMNVGSYFFGDKLVLRMYKAKEVTHNQEPELYAMVDEMRRAANLPMPKVYVIPSETPNAFATGRNPKHGVVACTKGIMHLLNKDELKGVIAHEIAHIKNRDILIATIAATIAAVISYVAQMAQWAAIFGGMSRDRDGGNTFALLGMAILTPIIAVIIQLAISRSREYLADETGARLSGKPEALASALKKIASGVSHNPMRFGNETTASMFILNPFRGKAFLSLFSTHPATEERIKRLHALKL